VLEVRRLLLEVRLELLGDFPVLICLKDLRGLHLVLQERRERHFHLAPPRSGRSGK
jgi:hypothetical protein